MTMANDTKKTILIVDDEKEVANLIEEYVSIMGDYNLVKANSGTEALDVAGKLLPDLILLDIMMDDIEGTDVCRALKAEKETSKIPVIAVTVIHRVDEERYNNIISSGMDEYLTKPINFDNLKGLLDRYLGGE
jgi:putative two-component system response regulator